MAKDKDEYEELWDERVSVNVDFSEVYTPDDFIKRIHDQYPLIGKGGGPHPLDHMIYQKMLELGRGETIQKNLTEWIEENINPEEYIPDEQEEELLADARGAYAPHLEEKVLEKAEMLAERNVSAITKDETGAIEEDVEPVVDSVVTPEKIPETDIIKRESELTQEIAKETESPSTVGLYRRLGVFKEVLRAFEVPRSSVDAAKYLQSRGIRTDVSESTVGRDIRRFKLTLKGYTTRVGNKMILTDKGKELLEKLEKLS
ncbi:MAG TPA: hypothetical protein ENF49_00345 [Candidatus Altiarchaeales archaeon]|nr:hypothetical protein [Candidatus Altiarchaeales archaeon]HEX54568.1 hypothetical protein [Candidatus Altiarchaeales archaeon]